MVGTVHQITIYASLTTSPPIVDTVGTSFTIKFTSILCSNAYLVYYPIYDVTYDVSLGTKYLITQLNWEKSDQNCPDITYTIIDIDTGA